MASSKKWAAIISSLASSLYFFLIIFQIPLFRLPCRKGICTTPVEVACTHLIASKVFPEFIAKLLLYPGAFANAIMKSKNIPSYSKLLQFYKFTNVKDSLETDLLHLEVLAGSYLSVTGAVFKAKRIRLIGTLLLLWGLVKEVMIFRFSFDKTKSNAVYIYPTLLIVVLCSLLCMRKDVRKMIRCYRGSRCATKYE